MNELAEKSPQWSLRLNELCSGMADLTDASLRAEAWQIVHFNLSRYLRYHGTRLGALSNDDISDIASQKTLELMRKVDVSSGPLMELAAERIPAFLSTVARNGLITFLKAARREVADENHLAADGRARSASDVSNPALAVESSEYARALERCVQELDGRARKLWFFRVCYEMSSKDIAAHPQIRMSASHIDVVLHRVRRAVRDCMKTRGHDTASMPAGTFMLLWQMMHPMGEATKEAM